MSDPATTRGLTPTITPQEGATGTRILVGPERQLVWQTRGTSVQVSAHTLDGAFEFVLATAEKGFSYEAALTAYALLKETS
jgi:hypothetical protein